MAFPSVTPRTPSVFSSPRRSRIRRRLTIAVVLAGLGAILVVFGYRLERGPELGKTLSDLLPAADTSLFMEVNRAGMFLDELEHVARSGGGDLPSDLYALSGDVFSKKDLDRLGFSSFRGLLNAVVSDSLQVAMLDSDSVVKRLSGDPVPAVLVWGRPQVGWRGVLATLIGPFLETDRITSSRYQGARFYQCRTGGLNENGFAWVRLGSAVLMRLDDADPTPLKRLVDRGKDLDDSPSAGEDVSLSQRVEFERQRSEGEKTPGLWGVGQGEKILKNLESLFPETLEAAVGPGWRPVLLDELQTYPRLSFHTHLSESRGLSLQVQWGASPDRETTTTFERIEALSEWDQVLRPSSGVSPVASDEAPSMVQLMARSRQIPEVIHWITLVTQSVSQVTEDEQETEDEKQAGQQVGIQETPEQKSLRRQERRVQKARRRALVRELANPLTTSRLVASLGEWASLEIRNAGLSQSGRWKPDWDFEALVDNERQLRDTAKSLFEAVEKREPLAVLLHEDDWTTESGVGNSGGDSILSPSDRPVMDLPTSTDVFGMDLREGRFLFRIPRERRLLIGVHRYREPGESPAAELGGRSSGLLDRLRFPEASGMQSSTPSVVMQVDWPRIAEHFDQLVEGSESDVFPAPPRPGVVAFRDAAKFLSDTGRTTFAVFAGDRGCDWVLNVSLRP